MIALTFVGLVAALGVILLICVAEPSQPTIEDLFSDYEKNPDNWEDEGPWTLPEERGY